MLPRIPMRLALPVLLAATLLPAAAFAQSQDTQSVAEAARRARAQKKNSEKPSKVITDDTLDVKKGDVQSATAEQLRIPGTPQAPAQAASNAPSTADQNEKKASDDEKRAKEIAALKEQIKQAQSDLDLAKREGAHQVFDHRSAGYTDAILKATGGRGVDIILEMLANVNLAADLKLLATRGRVIVIGSRGDVTITPRDLMLRRSSVRAFALWGIIETEEAQIHAGIIAGLDNGTLRPVVGKELPLAEAVRAHKEIMEPGAFGKIVLVS